MNKSLKNNLDKNPDIEKFELFESAIDTFILEIDALAESLPLIGGLLVYKLKSSSKLLDQFVKKKSKNEDDEEKEEFQISIEQFNEFNRLDRDYEIAKAAMDILPRHFIVSLVSQYDAYLAELYRTLFQIKPELAFSLDKTFTFQEILKYENLNILKENLIEKDVENLLRESHFEQLKVLEKRITKHLGKDFTLTTNLPILSTFIEVAERRNLFVHCNGIVSTQYLDVCKKHKVYDIDKIKLNDVLDVSPKYFEKAYRAYYEIGVKLSQVLWRKFLPDKIVEADKNLNNICYDLLYSGYYELAKTLLKFATEELPKNGNQADRKIFVVNKALAFYLSGDKDTTIRILDAEDFTIGKEFKLAVAVLKDDFELAKNLMIKIGDEDEVFSKESYQEFPLFKIFRETDEFKYAFKKVFKEDFIIREAPKKSFIKMLDSINQKKKEVVTKEKQKTAKKVISKAELSKIKKSDRRK